MERLLSVLGKSAQRGVAWRGTELSGAEKRRQRKREREMDTMFHTAKGPLSIIALIDFYSEGRIMTSNESPFTVPLANGHSGRPHPQQTKEHRYK